MTDDTTPDLREQLDALIGVPVGKPSVAPDPVNQAMIRHWNFPVLSHPSG